MEHKPKRVCSKSPGGTTCCASNFSSNSDGTPEVSFHKFPRDSGTKETWLNLLGISKKPFENHKVSQCKALYFPGAKKVLGALPTSSSFPNGQTSNSKIEEMYL